MGSCNISTKKHETFAKRYIPITEIKRIICKEYIRDSFEFDSFFTTIIHCFAVAVVYRRNKNSLNVSKNINGKQSADTGSGGASPLIWSDETQVLDNLMFYRKSICSTSICILPMGDIYVTQKRRK